MFYLDRDRWLWTRSYSYRRLEIWRCCFRDSNLKYHFWGVCVQLRHGISFFFIQNKILRQFHHINGIWWVFSCLQYPILEKIDGITSETMLLLWTMREKHNPDSKFKPYFDSLQKNFCTGNNHWTTTFQIFVAVLFRRDDKHWFSYRFEFRGWCNHGAWWYIAFRWNNAS